MRVAGFGGESEGVSATTRGNIVVVDSPVDLAVGGPSQGGAGVFVEVVDVAVGRVVELGNKG